MDRNIGRTSGSWGRFFVCLFFGWAGVHKFCDKKIGVGILYLLTFGLFGIGWLVDTVRYLASAVKGGSEPAQAPTARFLADDDPLPVVVGSGVFMGAGETCHYAGPATRIIVKNRVVGYTGGSSGVSVRVVKGVSYRVGQRRGAPVREDVQEQAPGTLTITNKRIVFTAARDSFDKRIAAVSSASPMDDGIILQVGDAQYILATEEPRYIYQIISRIIQTASA